MKRIVFDIETVGEDFELLDDPAKEYFLKFADTAQKVREAKDSLSFYPLTAQIVAIGMLDVQSAEGAVYFQSGIKAEEKFKEGSITFISGSEKEILGHFWNQLKRYDQFISFNGRVFDCPFIMLRSAMNCVRTTKNLMPYRYTHNCHVDLADQLGFYGAMYRKFSLHMWCKAFGIHSPKEEGVTGLQVKGLFKEGHFREIAQYCMRDVQATKELYRYWEEYLRF